MKSVEFCYWLQGLFELGAPESLTVAQTALLKKHLNMVFIHDIDPSYPAGQQEALNASHAGSSRPRPQIGGVNPLTDAVVRC